MDVGVLVKVVAKAVAFQYEPDVTMEPLLRLLRYLRLSVVTVKLSRTVYGCKKKAIVEALLNLQSAA